MRHHQSSNDARYAVGIDIGTSAVKVAILGSDGTDTEYVSSPYPVSVPAEGWAEQNPDDWWAALGEALTEAVGANPGIRPQNTVISLTGQMHTTVYRGAHGELLRPAVLWSDSRAKAEVRSLAADTENWAEITGNPLLPAFSAAHIAWVRTHEPEVFARVASICVPKDDIRRRLGAGFSTEPSDASGTALFDTTKGCWSRELLNAVGVTESVLPTIRESGEVIGEVQALPGTFVGDPSSIMGAPVVGGAGDQAALAMALDATEPGTVAISVGTSGAVMQASTRAVPGAFRHAVPNTWLALDSMHTAGMSMKWWASITPDIFSELDMRDLLADTEAPLFLPYLQGERGSGGRLAAFVGIGLEADARAMDLAVLEGIALELVRLVEDLCGGAVPGVVQIGGRAGRMPLIRQVLAAGLDRTVTYCHRSSAFGAAAVGAISAGWYGNCDAKGALQADPTYPDPKLGPVVRTRLKAFRRLRCVLIDPAR